MRSRRAASATSRWPTRHGRWRRVKTCSPCGSCSTCSVANVRRSCTPTIRSPVCTDGWRRRAAGVPVVVNTIHGLYALPDDRLAKRAQIQLSGDRRQDGLGLLDGRYDDRSGRVLEAVHVRRVRQPRHLQSGGQQAVAGERAGRASRVDDVVAGLSSRPRSCLPTRWRRGGCRRGRRATSAAGRTAARSSGRPRPSGPAASSPSRRTAVWPTPAGSGIVLPLEQRLRRTRGTAATAG